MQHLLFVGPGRELSAVGCRPPGRCERAALPVRACVCVCCRACLVFSVMSLYVECRGIRAPTFSVRCPPCERHTPHSWLVARTTVHDHIVGTRHDTPRRSAQSAQRSHQFSARPSVRVPRAYYYQFYSTSYLIATSSTLPRARRGALCVQWSAIWLFGWPRFRAPRKSRAIASASR